MAFKILSLDGGGSWALIQARVLLDIYGDISGHDILKKFDLAIANSGGSLVLACLCNDMAPSAIIDVFEDQQKRQKVFSYMDIKEKLTHPACLLRPWKVGPKYSTREKLIGLINVLESEDQLLKDGKINQPIVKTYLDEIPALIGKNYNNQDVQLVIVGYDYFRRRANFFRSRARSAANQFSPEFFRVTLGHAIHASSNAPVNYFDDPATITLSASGGNDTRSTWYWDGAVSGFNNPVLAGLIEAITNGVKPADCKILTIGTGTGERAIIADYSTSTDPILKEIYNANLNNSLVTTDHAFSFTNDVKELATSILADPPDSDTYIAYSIMHPGLDRSGNIIRINPTLKPELDMPSKMYKCPAVYDTDDTSRGNFQTLLDMDMDAVEQSQVDLITELCNKFIVNDGSQPRLPNQLIRGSLTTNYLGQPFYKEARDRWGDITGD
jgi:patatin-like phospholipase/acyl hydrolase